MNKKNKPKIKKKLGLIAFWLGLVIVILSHIYILVVGIPQSMMVGHAILNLIAAGFILIGGLKMQD